MVAWDKLRKLIGPLRVPLVKAIRWAVRANQDERLRERLFDFAIFRWGVRATYAYGLPCIVSREELPYILNARGLVGRGAEIGVRKGNYSKLLLETWEGKKLFSVDPWKEFDDTEYQDGANVSQAKHNSFYRETLHKLAAFEERSDVLRMTSAEAAPEFETGELDFAYLDAQHHYEAVEKDIRLWWPKIRPGGLLCGDDYMDGYLNGTKFGVKSAVDEFVAEKDLRLYVSAEEMYRSWFIFKPK